MTPQVKPQMLYRALAITDNPGFVVAYSEPEVDDALDTLVELAAFAAVQVLSPHPVSAPLPPASPLGNPMSLVASYDANDDSGMRDLLRSLVIDGAFNSQVGIRPGQLVDPHRIPKGDEAVTSPVVEADAGAINYKSEQVTLPPIVSDLLPPNVKMWASVALWAVNTISKLIKGRRSYNR